MDARGKQSWRAVFCKRKLSPGRGPGGGHSAELEGKAQPVPPVRGSKCPRLAQGCQLVNNLISTKGRPHQRPALFSCFFFFFFCSFTRFPKSHWDGAPWTSRGKTWRVTSATPHQSDPHFSDEQNQCETCKVGLGLSCLGSREDSSLVFPHCSQVYAIFLKIFADCHYDGVQNDRWPRLAWVSFLLAGLCLFSFCDEPGGRVTCGWETLKNQPRRNSQIDSSYDSNRDCSI